MDSKPDTKTAMGIPIEEFDERCRTCPALAVCALRYDSLLQKQDRDTLPRYQRDALWRLTLPRMGNMCPEGVQEDGSCGSLVEPKFPTLKDQQI